MQGFQGFVAGFRQVKLCLHKRNGFTVDANSNNGGALAHGLIKAVTAGQFSDHHAASGARVKSIHQCNGTKIIRPVADRAALISGPNAHAHCQGGTAGKVHQG